MNVNLIEVLQTVCQEAPDRLALIHGAERITYRELAARSSAVGAFLQTHGIRPGQRALLLAPLGIELYVLFLGLVRIGVTVVLIDPAVGKAQLAACCAQAQPDLLIGSPKAHLLRFGHAAIRRIPQKFALGWPLPGAIALPTQGEGPTCRDTVTLADDPALITFTSGSTGQPKAICRTHGFLLHQHELLCRTIPAKAGDVEMNTLPVFILSSLARGLTVVIPHSFRGRPTTVDGAEVVQELVTHRVKRLLAAPDFCQRLVEQLTVTDQTLPVIERVYTGGGPVFPVLYDALQQRLPNAAITAVYGSTEAEPIAHCNLSTLLAQDRQAMARGHGLLAGKPIAAVQLAILPDQAGQPIGPFSAEQFALAQLPANCAGEIVVSGDHVQKRYLGGDDGLTKFCVGATIWHRTGDAGYLDGHGRLWLLGRCTARIGQGAAVRYPFAVEAAALSHAGVERAAFVEVNGQGILAVQAARQSWPALATALRHALPTVASVERLDAIPVDSRHGSKVLYGQVRALLQG